MGLPVVEMFLGFSARSSDGAEIVERPIVKTAQVESRVSFVARVIIEREAWGGQRQKLYADRRVKILELVLEQLIAKTRVFAQHWAGYLLISGENGKNTDLMEAPSTSEMYLCLGGNITGIHFR